MKGIKPFQIREGGKDIPLNLEKCNKVVKIIFNIRGVVHEICAAGERGSLSPACTLSNPGPLGGCPTAGVGPIPTGSRTSLSKSGTASS